jgi:hypothetical protein
LGPLLLICGGRWVFISERVMGMEWDGGEVSVGGETI